MNLQETIRRILKEETEDGIKDIMFDMFDENTKGSEIYEYENSLWMIIPEQKEWIFEIQDDLTLWYNLPFFEKIYKYVSLDVINNQHYITEWVEYIINTGVRDTLDGLAGQTPSVEDIINTGVRDTSSGFTPALRFIDNILNKGVKNTEWANAYDSDYVDKVLKKGIKNTQPDAIYKAYQVQDILKRGKKG